MLWGNEQRILIKAFWSFDEYHFVDLIPHAHFFHPTLLHLQTSSIPRLSPPPSLEVLPPACA
jgi:hypothetical protein